MRKVREMFRLHHEAGLSARKIARSLNMTHTAVNNYLKRFQEATLDEGAMGSLSDSELEQKLFPPAPQAPIYPIPDWTLIHQELRQKGVTLQSLHEDYAKTHPEGHYGYTWFTKRYRAYAKKLNVSMKQHHKAGEKVFVDFSGMSMPIVNPMTGEVTQVEIFVGVLGASDYPFVMAVPSQQKRDFYEAHVKMFEYFGGVPELIIPDNLRSGVLKADRYDPDLNPDYQALATHYGCAIFPARPYKPKDKAKVENGVKIIQRWILARLRHETFTSLAQLNARIGELLKDVVQRPMKRTGKTRAELFETLDRPVLKPLPATAYDYKEFKLLKVSIDYHIQLEGVMYSVPYQLAHERVEVWYGSRSVEITHNGKVVATHPRIFQKGVYSTQTHHMASAHKRYEEWNPGRILNWGASIGTETIELLKQVLDHRPHPEMGFRTCMGIMSAYKKQLNLGWSEEQLEAISRQARLSHQLKSGPIKTLIKERERHRDWEREQEEQARSLLSAHANIRGGDYYA